MSLQKRSIDDATAESSDLTATTADDADLPSAEIPIAIGDPAVPGALPVSNLLEYLRDALASFITQGTNVTVTHDDAANTLTIAATDTNTQRSDEEIRDLIAGFLTQGTNITVTHDDAGDTLTIAAAQKTDEAIRDLIAGFITQGSNVTVTHDDAANTLTIAATDTNTQRSDEEIRDLIAGFLTQGTNITVTHDDAGDTLTIAAAQKTDEAIRDLIAGFITQGSNVTVTHDDAANTLTIAATGSGGLSAEQVRDTVASFIVQGSNVTVTHDDAGNTLTIAATGTTLSDEEIQDKVAAFMPNTADILVLYDDTTNTLSLLTYKQTDIATWNIQTSDIVLNAGDLRIGSTTQTTFRRVDADATDQNTWLGSVAVDDVLIVILESDTTKWQARQVTAAPTVGTNSYIFSTTTLAGSAPTSDFANGAGVTVRHGVPLRRRTDEEIRDTIAGFVTAGTGVSVVHDDVANTLTFNVDAENIQDVVGALLTAGTGISISYDDTANTLTVTADSENIRDTVASFLRPGTNMDVLHNDASDTLTLEVIERLSQGQWVIETGTIDANGEATLGETTLVIRRYNSSGVDRAPWVQSTNVGDRILIVKNSDASKIVKYTITGNEGYVGGGFATFSIPVSRAGYSSPLSDFADGDVIDVYGLKTAESPKTDEQIRDLIAGFIVGGTNVSVTHDDAGNTLTIASTGGGAPLTTEQVQDIIGALIQRDSNGGIDVNYDDTNGALTLSPTTQTTLGNWRSRAAGVTLTDGDAEIDGANSEVVVRLTDKEGNDKTTELGTIAAGDQIHIDSGSDDLYLRVTAAPTLNTNDYTIPIALLPGSTAFADFSVNGTDTWTLLKSVATTRRTDEDIRDVTAAQLQAGASITLTEDDVNDTLTVAAPWTRIYGSKTTELESSATQNLIAGESFDDYDEILIVGCHTGNDRNFSDLVPIEMFNAANDDIQTANDSAYLVVRRLTATTFQLNSYGNDGGLRAIYGR